MLLSSRRALPWYDVIFILIALSMVYPEWLTDKLGEITGKEYGLTHILVFEVIGAVMMTALTLAVMPNYPRVEWWHPLAVLGGTVGLRVIHSFLVSLFD